MKFCGVWRAIFSFALALSDETFHSPSPSRMKFCGVWCAIFSFAIALSDEILRRVVCNLFIRDRPLG
jgi:fructose-bisphosphate aldolase class 1